MLYRYRTACESIILGDYEQARSNHFEDKLWDVHLKANGIYKNAYRKVRPLYGYLRPDC